MLIPNFATYLYQKMDSFQEKSTFMITLATNVKTQYILWSFWGTSYRLILKRLISFNVDGIGLHKTVQKKNTINIYTGMTHFGDTRAGGKKCD